MLTSARFCSFHNSLQIRQLYKAYFNKLLFKYGGGGHFNNGSLKKMARRQQRNRLLFKNLLRRILAENASEFCGKDIIFSVKDYKLKSQIFMWFPVEALTFNEYFFAYMQDFPGQLNQRKLT